MEVAQRVRAILSFVQTADAGSFAAAARALDISAAAVSKNVAALEQGLGVRLFNRTTRTLSLTGEGAAFLKQARLALEALDAAVDTVAAHGGDLAGHVRISTSAAFGRDQLMPALPGLRARYPALTVEVDFDDRVTDLVRDGYDLAIRGGQIADSALVSRAICKLHLVLVASPAYLAAHGTPSSLEDLKEHWAVNYFSSQTGRDLPWEYVVDGEVRTLSVRSRVSVGSSEAYLGANLAGIGLAQIPRPGIEALLERGELVEVLPEWRPPAMPVSIVYSHNRHLSPRVRVFVDWLAERMAAAS